MTQFACILAAPDLAIESDLVGQAAAYELRIVRRCLDAADLLAVAALDTSLAIAVSPGLARLTRDLVARLGLERMVVGLAHDEDSAQQLRNLGISLIVPVRSAAQTLADLCAELRGTHQLPTRPEQLGVWSTGAWAASPSVDLPRKASLPSPKAAGRPRPSGGVISVWGAPGSPGRTSATLLLGRLLATGTRTVCVIDADTTAPSLLQLLDIAENASSVVVACRFAEREPLTIERLRQTVHCVDRSFYALGGITSPEQWGDIRASALQSVLATSREAFDLTIVDVGSGLERSEPTDILSAQRFSAASAAIVSSDVLLGVARASDLGISRFLQHAPVGFNGASAAKAVAVTPSGSAVSSAEAIATLRDYGLQLPIFELPDYAIEDITAARTQNMHRKRKWRRAGGIQMLQQWVLDAVAGSLPAHGDGSTTTLVPTRANL
ncbi:MAG: hypothetical protein Q7K25_03155 [Actinomycetota bacterium]|nr:hypothetical protein [Actinomycetota bacterium]